MSTDATGAKMPSCRKFHNRGVVRGISPDKPRLSINELAAKRSRCQEAKAAGLPCNEFSTGSVVVPQPPKLDLSPTSNRALVTVVVGDEGRELFAISGTGMKAYAERVGADLVILDWPGHPSWPMSAKFAIPRTLDHYSRIAYVDADVILRPDAVDLFEMCNEDEFGACDELPFHRNQPQHGVEKRYQSFRRQLGFKSVPMLPWYLNCGVMVVPARYRDLLLPPTKPLPIHHCGEQDHTNGRILDAALSGSLKYRLLDRRANWQNWNDHGFKHAPPDAILHLSGSGAQRQKRLDDMKSLADAHPWFAPMRSTNPEWEIDARHLHWLQAVLATGRFKKVLEIGCHHGYSTQAFLSVAGALDVHLCDVAFREQLAKRIDNWRVAFHQRQSVDVIREHGPFDLVFVDGDHSLSTVSEEAKLLISQGTTAIFAHDTSAAGNYPECEGPDEMRRMVLAAGYFGFEDNLARSGERTDRGMFWAARDQAIFDLGVNLWQKHAAKRMTKIVALPSG